MLRPTRVSAAPYLAALLGAAALAGCSKPSDDDLYRSAGGPAATEGTLANRPEPSAPTTAAPVAPVAGAAAEGAAPERPNTEGGVTPTRVEPPAAAANAPAGAASGDDSRAGNDSAEGNADADDDAPVNDGANVPAPEEEPPVLPEAPTPRACPVPVAPLLLDFAELSDDPGQAMFGDFDVQLSGGTFYYPDSPDAFALRSDVTGGNWRIQGPVGSSAGFGLFFYECQRVDASRFGGIAFRIRGNVARGGQVTLLVGTASNQVAHDWLVQSGTDPNAPVSFGRCQPAATRFDGSCNSAQVTVPVAAGVRDVRVPFTTFAQGSPEAGVNPAEITSIQWSLPKPATAADGTPVPYAVDLRIDDIRFVQ